MPEKHAKKEEPRHALVGGWTKRRGRSISLLLGVRQGRRRKLTYVGEARTSPDDLFMNLLEERLRAAEIESSPFADDVPESPDTRYH